MFTEEVQKKIYSAYLDWFNAAEEERRWNLRKDIPWEKTTRGAVPVDLVTIVETFCGIEAVLPDYIVGLTRVNRRLRGMAWFVADWGYEESKHSLALTEWLVRSGSRTNEEMWQFQNQIFQKNLKTSYWTPRTLVLYTMIQELATCMSYVNLEKKVKPYGDPALSKLLYFIFRDEMAHHKFNVEIVKIHLEEDRAATLRELVRTVAEFEMPAPEMIPHWAWRDRIIQKNHVMTPELFIEEIFYPTLKQLGISKEEWKRASRAAKEEARPPLDEHTLFCPVN